MELAYAADLPPLAAIAAGRVGSVGLNPVSRLPEGTNPELRLQSGKTLVGLKSILQYIVQVSSLQGFGATTTSTASQVDQWLDYSQSFSVGVGFEPSCEYVNSYLTIHTFLVGYNLTVADITLWFAIAGAGKRWESMRKSGRFQALTRWYNGISLQHPELEDVASVYGAGEKQGLRRGPEKPLAVHAEVLTAEKLMINNWAFEMDLPDAEVGKVCTRFALEPRGYLHLGHAKAALLNDYFARKYQGRLIVRFEDTNASREMDGYVHNMLQDLNTLWIKPDAVSYTSDYFPQLMEMAVKLINEGKAYVDDTPREVMQNERMERIESRCRNQSVGENLELWKEMIDGTERGSNCCLRGKLDMQARNETLRDPVYFRCAPYTEHPRAASDLNVCPTRDFACPLLDSFEGVTHALFPSDHRDRIEQYYRVLEDTGLANIPYTWEFNRLNFVYTLFSKRKLQWFVDKGLVEGWDDPRLATVQGIMRHGLTVEALRRFILSQGASKNQNKLMEWDKLWTINKQMIDPVCPRHTAVLADGKVALTLRGLTESPFVRVIPRHKKFEGAGKKATVYASRIWIDKADAEAILEGDEVTLMDWGNATVEKVHRDQDNKVVALSGVLHLQGPVKTATLKLTWLADQPELVSLTLVNLDNLITKEKMEEGDDLTEILNPVTMIETEALGDSNMRNLAKGEIIQLEGKGYYICERPFVRASCPMKLISIPDGRKRQRPSRRTGTALLFLRNQDGQAVMLADSKISQNEHEADEEEYKLKRLTAESNLWVSVGGDVPSGDGMLHEIIHDLSADRLRSCSSGNIRLFERVLRARAEVWRAQSYGPVKAFCFIVVERTGEDEAVPACLINVSARLHITVERGNVLCAGIGGPLAVAELRRCLNAKGCVIYGKSRTELQNTVGITAVEEIGPLLLRLKFESVDALLEYEATNDIQDHDLHIEVGGVDLINLGLLAMRAPINLMEDHCDEPVLVRSFHINLSKNTKSQIVSEFDTGYGAWRGMRVRINVPYRSWLYQLTENKNTEIAERLAQIRYDEDEVEDDGVELDSNGTSAGLGSEKEQPGDKPEEPEDMDGDDKGYEAENESEGLRTKLYVPEDVDQEDSPGVQQGRYEPGSDPMDTDQYYSGSNSEGRTDEETLRCESEHVTNSSEEEENDEPVRHIAGEQPTPILLIRLLTSLLSRHNATGYTDDAYLKFLNQLLKDVQGSHNFYFLNTKAQTGPEESREHGHSSRRGSRRNAEEVVVDVEGIVESGEAVVDVDVE